MKNDEDEKEKKGIAKEMTEIEEMTETKIVDVIESRKNRNIHNIHQIVSHSINSNASFLSKKHTYTTHSNTHQ